MNKMEALMAARHRIQTAEMELKIQISVVKDARRELAHAWKALNRLFDEVAAGVQQLPFGNSGPDDPANNDYGGFPDSNGETPRSGHDLVTSRPGSNPAHWVSEAEKPRKKRTKDV